MTEEEAKTKWCPVANTRFIAGDEPRMAADRCIGSACMAWRKTGDAKVENRKGQLVDRDMDGTGRWHYEGFCGLAGKP